MRIHTFQIERFGCFEKQLLDFSGGSSGLHIIYGPNEAGKSTALRAIVNMLYGIPAQTSDAFLYSYDDMRLAASLENLSGDVATFIRRKGNKATLLDSNQQPLDEGVLAAFLCGIPEKAFTTMFGFDYQVLLRGRQDLKDGKGDLAESLFQAGMGVTGLRGILEGLQRDKEAMFSPRASAKNPLVNSALHRYKESMKNVNELSVRPRDWHKLADDIAKVENEFARTKEEHERCSVEKARYERYQKAFPLASRRAVIMESLSELPAECTLTQSQIEQYQRNEENRRNALSEQDRIDAQKREIADRWTDPSLIDRLISHKDDVASVQSRLKQYESAQHDLPKVITEQGRHDSKAKGLIQSHGVEHLLKSPGFTCIDGVQRATIVEFSKKHFQVEKPTKDIMSCAPKDSSCLKQRTEAASSEGKIEEAASRARTKIADLRAQAQRGLEALTLWGGTLEQVETLPVPLDETISRFLREFTGIDSLIRDAERDIEACEVDRTRSAEKISVFLQAQPVPSEDDLVGDRDRREHGWQLVCRAWLSAEDVSVDLAAFDPDHPLDQAYKLSVEKADVTADRLRREADRVASLAELKATLSKAECRMEQLRHDLSGLQTQRREKEQEWIAQWKPVGIEEPLTPAEMQEWSQRHRALAQLCVNTREGEAGLSEMEKLIDSHRKQLLDELANLGLAEVPEEATLQDIISRGRGIVEAVTALKELVAEIEQGDDCRSRARQMETSIARFASDIAQLISDTQMTELTGVDAGDAAREIQEKLQQAAKDQARLDLLESQYEATKATQVAAETTLTALADEVGCADLQSLEAAVKDSEKRYDLDGRKTELDDKLAAYSSGASVETLVQELSEVNEDELAGLIAGLAKEIVELDARRDELSNERGEKRTALGNLDRSDELAAEVQSAQGAIAEAKSAVEHYVSLHLAAEILGMEIERYQKENQDPVLARASEIFPALTLSSFRGVSTQHTTKGNQVIVGVRPSGTAVDVSGMSDGTRDQLYLALRIASLEQHVRSGVILPLILDDVLIEFDDERASVALETLAQLSDKTQVLYFTHHRHIVDLANKAVGGSRMHIHELTPNVAT